MPWPQEAVGAACVALEDAAARIGKRSTPLDGQLFSIKHLFILREQVSAFDVDFFLTDVDLDFLHLRDQLRRIISGDFSMFSRAASISQIVSR